MRLTYLLSQPPVIGQSLHSDKDHQMPFVGNPDTRITNPRWRTAAILKIKKVVLMNIINSLLKTGNKTANINVKNCSLYTLLTATDQKRKIIKRQR